MLINCQQNGVGSTSSSPAMLDIKEHTDNQKTQTMQSYNYQGENNINKNKYIGSAKASQYSFGPYTSLSREGSTREQVYHTNKIGHRNDDTYRTYLHSQHAYEDSCLEKMLHYFPSDYSQAHGFKTRSKYLDFYSSTRRSSHYNEHYQRSPDSWV